MNTLDLIERDLVLDPVVELRGPCRLMTGDLRRNLEIAAVSESRGRSAGGPAPPAQNPYVRVGIRFLADQIRSSGEFRAHGLGGRQGVLSENRCLKFMPGTARRL